MKTRLALVFVLFACSAAPPSGPKLPEGSAAGCDVACAQMERLGCDVGKPTTVRKTPCVDVCRQVESSGSSFHTTCLASASDCAQSERCGERAP